MTKATNVPFWRGETSSELPMTRFDRPVDSTIAMGANNAANNAAFQKNFLGLNKSVDGDDLYTKAYVFHEVRPNGQLGIDHDNPLPTRQLQYFGLKTGSYADPLPPVPYPKKYTAYGA